MGRYQYRSPSGQIITVTYIADENGYRPKFIIESKRKETETSGRGGGGGGFGGSLRIGSSLIGDAIRSLVG